MEKILISGNDGVIIQKQDEVEGVAALQILQILRKAGFNNEINRVEIFKTSYSIRLRRQLQKMKKKWKNHIFACGTENGKLIIFASEAAFLYLTSQKMKIEKMQCKEAAAILKENCLKR